MHPSDEKPVELLNKLLQLNYSRYNGFQQAVRQTDVSVLQVLFERLTDTSSECSEDLCREIYKLGGAPVKQKLKGPFETAWTEINQALIENDHLALLNSCYCEEQMSYKLYEYTLRNHETILASSLKELFIRQKEMIVEDHQRVFNLRKVLLEAA